MNATRRKFLQTAGQGLAGIALSSKLEAAANNPEMNDQEKFYQDDTDDTTPIQLKDIEARTEQQQPAVPSPLRPSKRIGYAIVGLGHLALNQVMPAFSKCKFSKPVALVSGDATKAQKVAHQYGIDPANVYDYTNYDNIRNNPSIDAVYIILPNSMHEEYTVRAAKAGKHVLCEKPMTTSSASAQRMIDACKAANKKLMIAYRIQYEPSHRQIMKWVRDQRFGRVRVIDLFNGQNTIDPSHWRLKKAIAGGGSLPDIGLYNLNTARYLLGEEPVMITATSFSTPGDERFKEVEESMLFQMRFPGGALVTAGCCYSVHKSRYYRCHADNGGTLGMNNAFDYTGLQMEISYAEGKIENKTNPVLAGTTDQFSLEIDHMSTCILHNKTPYTPGEEGLQDQKLMEAIYEAARTGKPVSLPLITTKDAFRGDAPDT